MPLQQGGYVSTLVDIIIPFYVGLNVDFNEYLSSSPNVVPVSMSTLKTIADAYHRPSSFLR